MGAAALQVAHVPESAASGLVASVVADAKPTTLGSALREAGVSQGHHRRACGVSQQGRSVGLPGPRRRAAPGARPPDAAQRAQSLGEGAGGRQTRR